MKIVSHHAGDFRRSLLRCRAMSSLPTSYRRVLAVLTALLIVKVTAAVVWNYRNYLPPDFDADFLQGRESYFFDGYQWAFYAHIASGPVALLAGLLLVSDRFRMRRPAWHRALGNFQIANVLVLLAPSGLWMAFYPASGTVAGLSFASLSLATAACAALGWRAAMQRRFVDHRRWMLRTFVLLCSAVTLRLAAGLATVIGVQSAWFDPVAAWACWIVPMAIYELITHGATRGLSSRAGFRRAGVTRYNTIH
jgi:hypothetical protein